MRRYKNVPEESLISPTTMKHLATFGKCANSGPKELTGTCCISESLRLAVNYRIYVHVQGLSRSWYFGSRHICSVYTTENGKRSAFLGVGCVGVVFPALHDEFGVVIVVQAYKILWRAVDPRQRSNSGAEDLRCILEPD